MARGLQCSDEASVQPYKENPHNVRVFHTAQFRFADVVCNRRVMKGFEISNYSVQALYSFIAAKHIVLIEVCILNNCNICIWVSHNVLLYHYFLLL